MNPILLIGDAYSEMYTWIAEARSKGVDVKGLEAPMAKLSSAVAAFQALNPVAPEISGTVPA
jgi:hypothetical protein